MTDTIVDRLLKEAVESNRLKIEKHNLVIGELGSEVARLYAESEEYLKEYRKACPHTEKTKESFYTEGGYDYKSETTYITKCVRCGEKLNTRVEQGSYA